jgi:ATP synthase protein I
MAIERSIRGGSPPDSNVSEVAIWDGRPEKIVISFAIGRTGGVTVADGPTPDQRAQLSAAGIAAGLGCSIVVTIVVMIGGGILLDDVFDTSPVLTLVGVGLGLAAAGYQLYELAQVGRPAKRAPLLTRGLTHLPVGRRVSDRTGGSGRVGPDPENHDSGPGDRHGSGHG